MKKIILSIIAISFSFGVYAQNLAQADSVWNVIKNETVRGANTATRVGGAGNAIIAGIRDTLANFFTSTDLSNYVTLTDSQNISGNKYFNNIGVSSMRNASTNKLFFYCDGSNVSIKNMDEATIFSLLSNDTKMIGFNRKYLLRNTPNEVYMEAYYNGNYCFKNNIYGFQLYGWNTVFIDLTKGTNKLQTPTGNTLISSTDSLDFYREVALCSVSETKFKKGSTNYFTMKSDSLLVYKPILSNSTIQSQGIYASLEVDSVTTSQSMTNGVWNKLTAFNKVGLTENCTAVADSIIITKTGKYEVQFNFCSQSGTENLTIETCVFINGIKNGVRTVRDLVAVDTESNVSCSRFVSLTAGDVLDVRVKHDNGTPIDLTTKYGSFSVKYIGN